METNKDTEDANSSKKVTVKKINYHGACCAVVNCTNTKNNHPEMSFFRFPLDEE
ncbi:hypothetical protein SK128_028254, partial [Halocaridina rubra]